MTAARPASATTVFLDQPPSCMQFCPAAPNTFVIGTYLLSEKKDDEGNVVEQSKTGSLQLWNIEPEQNNLTLIHRISVPYAVFDLHFHPRDPSLLAIASSVGSVALFRVSGPSPTEITHLWARPVHDDPSIPALFLAWTPPHWLNREQADGFAVTFSDGSTVVFGCDSTATLSEKSDEIAELGSFAAKQPIEVWFVALAAVQDEESSSASTTTRFLFTGNDFGSLHTRRLAQASEQDEDELLSPLLLDHDDRGRHHTAGVTSILPLPLPLVDGAPLLLTGSYDEYLRVYHATRPGDVLAEECLGGGVWRLQLLKTTHESVEGGARWTFLVLASCMHAGTRVVRVTGEMKEGSEPQWGIEVLAEFTEHESMNYASDVWKPRGGYDLQGQEGSELLCVSSSFYDRRVCIWRTSV
ncbi:uncharacterized protein LDX57_004557 [Aspergillus melleus]|uniref:uncharacterized protein n=1 Tax=Aspergillus melleus TaxID=138277 RepID=UPI001E8D9E1D|nr:uncharacterized protein LDX57_004557 [Aspergillus melleus]KAH8426826.1 hypothetical protein LDX57_004557 [Aspergillus melleus]